MTTSPMFNKYSDHFTTQEFDRVLETFTSGQLLSMNNYDELRETMIYSSAKEKVAITHRKTMFVRFTYYSNTRTFLAVFHALWQKYFEESAINEIVSIVGTQNAKNVQRQLVKKKA